MTDDKIEAARATRELFLEELEALEKGSYDSFRSFILRYFSDTQAYQDMNTIISAAESVQLPLSSIDGFMAYFKETAFNEIKKKIDRFTYEEIKIGFMR
jgi:hypothetical protein